MPFYEVIDDYVPRPNQVIMSGLLNNSKLPWYYNPRTTHSTERYQRHQYTNTFFRFGEPTQSEDDFRILRNVLPFPEYDTHTLWRIKFNMTNPYKNRGIISPHIDVEVPGIVYLYYAVDSDWDTRLYPNLEKGYGRWWKWSKEIRVSPKQGRVIRMSSDLWHSSCVPHVYEKRIVGNFVFLDPSVSADDIEKLRGGREYVTVPPTE